MLVAQLRPSQIVRSLHKVANRSAASPRGMPPCGAIACVKRPTCRSTLAPGLMLTPYVPAPTVTCAVPAQAVTNAASLAKRASPAAPVASSWKTFFQPPFDISHEQPCVRRDARDRKPVEYAQSVPVASAASAVMYAVAPALTTFTRE